MDVWARFLFFYFCTGTLYTHRFSELRTQNYKLQLQISLEHRVEHVHTHVIHAVGLVLLYKILYH